MADRIDDYDFYSPDKEVIFYEDPYNSDNKMIHSISFSTNLDNDAVDVFESWKNTFREWHLVPKTRPVVNPPETRTEYSTIQNVDGILDFSESLDGTIHYGMRKGSWAFAVDHELNAPILWNKIYDDIMREIHGRKVRVCLQDDAGFYYQGRVFVNEWKSDKYWSEIVLDYELEPYKYTINTSGDYDWMLNDAIAHRKKQLIYANFTVEGVKYRDFYYTGKEKIKPVFETDTEGIMVQTHYSKNNVELELSTKAQRYGSLKLSNGHNYFTFYGHGTVSVYYNLGASL